MRFPTSDEKPFRVQRVCRYRVARYPSHADPDPTVHPVPVPYPWANVALGALAGLAVGACRDSHAQDTVPKANPASSLRAQSLSPVNAASVRAAINAAMRQPVSGTQNPFAPGTKGASLPFVTSSYGTGIPTYIQEAVSRALIAEVFRAEGLSLKPCVFHEDKLHFEATGYDPVKAAGFVLAGAKNSAFDFYIEWEDHELIRLGRLTEFPRAVPDGYGYTVRSFLGEAVDRTVQSTAMSAEMLAEGEAITKLADLMEMCRRYTAWRLKLDDAKLSAKEASQLDEDARQRRRYVAVIGSGDSRLALNRLRDPAQQTLADELILQMLQLGPDSPETARQKAALQKQIDDMRAAANARILEDFALSVREYIAWARRNGMQ